MRAEVKNPSGALTDCVINDKADGTYDVEYTPFENGNDESGLRYLIHIKPVIFKSTTPDCV